MKAAGGINSIFMMHSVLAVSSANKVKNEMYRPTDTSVQTKQSQSPFSQILHQKVEELQADPMECHTLTYGQDSKLHAFQYQTREYHY